MQRELDLVVFSTTVLGQKIVYKSVEHRLKREKHVDNPYLKGSGQSFLLFPVFN